NTFSGNISASAGTIAVNASGTDVAVTSFNVTGGATLLVDDSGTNVNNRLGTSSSSAAALNLAGGTFTLTGNASAATTEQLGTITAQSGYSTVNLNKGAGGNLTPGANTLASNTTLTGVAPFVNLVGALTGSTLDLGGTDSHNLPVNVGSLGTVAGNAAAIATVNGVISGTTLDVAGAGTTILNTRDTYAGPTTLESGTLSLGNPTSLGSG